MNPLNLSVETSSPSRSCVWLMSQNVAVVAKYAPFVVCLASGKLDEDAFRLLIALDAHFLREFETAYMKAEEYADDGDAKVAVSNLRRAVSDKLYRLNNSIAQMQPLQLCHEQQLDFLEYYVVMEFVPRTPFLTWTRMSRT
ncbi:hypothetical protein KSP40_PGU007177 [Platanthera guangdongensis]|uniref:Uncharacterized protein n=1 Tax=Platanthera guangdongensis TaxID=2320717 RepID=A0ABR2MIG9_9ASPA